MPKRDKDSEAQALQWIADVLEMKIKSCFEDALTDGVILCELINKLAPGSIKRFNKNPKMNMHKMENCAAFQTALKNYGLPERELFQSVDLVEKRNINQVHICILGLARVAQTKPDYSGPEFGPKQANKNERAFTQEQLDAGKHVINTAQMGYAGGANASGVSMGSTRHM